MVRDHSCRGAGSIITWPGERGTGLTPRCSASQAPRPMNAPVLFMVCAAFVVEDANCPVLWLKLRSPVPVSLRRAPIEQRPRSPGRDVDLGTDAALVGTATC